MELSIDDLNKRAKYLEEKAERLYERVQSCCREADRHGPYTSAWDEEIRELSRQEDATRDELRDLKRRLYGV